MLVLFFAFSIAVSFSTASTPCLQRSYGDSSVVCVCNATYCDTYDHVDKPPQDEFLLYTTNKEGLRLQKYQFPFMSKLDQAEELTFEVDRSKTFQRIIGFGAAFTDSAGINLHSLSENTQHHLLKSYYSEEGLEYNLGRVPIAGTDFSTRPYSYDDVPEDEDLTHFSLVKEDLEHKIPVIHKALDLRKSVGDGYNLKLFASPWAPPAWMKTNNKTNNGGFLRSEYQKAWARYFLRFLEEYDAEGINFWALTIQNEPTAGFLPFYKWNSMAWFPWGEGSFVRKHLSPALKESKFADTVLISMDDQRFSLPIWSFGLFNNPFNKELYQGVGIHWYHDDRFGPHYLNSFHEKHPDLFLLYTEACEEHAPVLGKWELAERYAHNILEDLNHHVSGWTDWNFALDLQGGPNWVENFVDSPIIVDADKDEFYKQPSFYALGHFSKFIPRGSIRIEMKTDLDTDLEYAAFLTPSENIVAIILNFSDKEDAITVKEGETSLSFQIVPNSINTVIW